MKFLKKNKKKKLTFFGSFLKQNKKRWKTVTKVVQPKNIFVVKNRIEEKFLNKNLLLQTVFSFGLSKPILPCEYFQSNYLVKNPLTVFGMKMFFERVQKQFFYSLVGVEKNLNQAVVTILESDFVLSSLQNEKILSSFYSAKLKNWTKYLTRGTSVSIFLKGKIFDRNQFKFFFTKTFVDFFYFVNSKAANQFKVSTETFFLQKSVPALSFDSNSIFFARKFNNPTFSFSSNSFKFSDYLRYKYISSIFNGRVLASVNNIVLKTFLNRTLKNKNFSSFLWKRNTLSFKKVVYLKTGLNKTNLGQARNIAPGFALILQRLEEKIDLLKALKKSENKISDLIFLRQFLLSQFELNNSQVKNKSYILINKRKLRSFKGRRNIRQKLLISILKRKPSLFFGVKKSRIFVAKQVKNSRLFNKIKSGLTALNKRQRWKKVVGKNISFTGKRLVINTLYYDQKQTRELLELFTGLKTSFYFINALAFARFGFHLRMGKKNELLKKKKSSLIFLQKIEREFVNKYKYVANYIQDLVRIGFISLYLKNATFLARFIAFQVAKLPKNRRETQLIRFIIKAIKIFAAQRREMLGVKIQFKGRVNRWRRTKAIVAERGRIPFYKYDARIEYGTAKSITRKGALGIRLWFRYNPPFQGEFKEDFIRYIEYSKTIKHKTYNRLLNKF